ncbi:uncharacterized protein LOC124677680 isoform X2 [Lolium rigidum]|uniref:uncharacterized protein LOC124677680 isoform X2 n=1 Tax=Lolium rigidum TaxID=89674 RepID=UPI001F5C479A|nr:uncharacterized protein LOC124677680 isoform X2 [Lolium rigidum]
MASSSQMAAPPPPEKKAPRSLFDLPSDFFESYVLLRAHPAFAPSPAEPSEPSRPASVPAQQQQQPTEAAGLRWTCNTCGAEFESLQEQREHFKSDLHRLNVKLSVAGKTIIKEEDLEKVDADSLFDDLDVSSVSGSEDELDNVPASDHRLSVKGKEEFRKKLFFRGHSGDTVSFWRCVLFKEHEEPFFDCKSGTMESHGSTSFVHEDEMISRVKHLACEPRDASRLRIIILTSGGHFAGCVFDGNKILANKTFHRYVVRAKAGKRQSGKDATGKVAHSAGSSLRRYNEAALKKEVQELIVSWKPYFDACVCAYIYAPSKNRQMLFDGDKAQSVLQACDIRPLPLTVHRPTLKEAKRVYSNLTQLYYETECSIMAEVLPHVETVTKFEQSTEANEEIIVAPKEPMLDSLNTHEAMTIPLSNNATTPLHEAAKAGSIEQIMELLEQGLDPCVKDERGKTPYMLASDKEVRNTFRRFMAQNLDKWDWHAADVPSALTKEMEESQAAKQAEKDAKKKARAKELKKQKKAREKEKEKEKALASQADVKGTSAGQMAKGTASAPGLKLKHPQAVALSMQYRSTDTATSTAAPHVCISIQKWWKMTEQILWIKEELDDVDLAHVEGQSAGRPDVDPLNKSVPAGRYFAALRGPELDEVRDYEDILLPKDEVWPFLLRFPIGCFGVCLGLGSQAILWGALAASPAMRFLRVTPMINVVVWLLAVAVLVATSVTYALKCVFYFEAIRREFFHPVRVNFFFTPSIAAMFLAIGLPRAFAPATLHPAVWCAFVAPLFALELKIYGQWLSGGKRRLCKVANPSSHLSVVGNFVGAILAARVGWEEAGKFLWAIGMSHYIVVFVTLYQRLPTNEALPMELHPVYSMFIATPSAASLAWAAIYGSFDAVARTFFFMALFLYMSLVVRINFFRGFRFSIAWWSYTFPMTTASLATVKYAEAVPCFMTRALALSLSLMSTTMVSMLLVSTLLHAFVWRSLFPNDLAIAITKDRQGGAKPYGKGRKASKRVNDIKRWAKQAPLSLVSSITKSNSADKEEEERTD